MALRKFIIERDIPKVGSFDANQLSSAAAKSNEVLCKIGAQDIQWVESYVADDKTFCVYLATDEAAIRRHSEMSGFPADKLTEIRTARTRGRRTENPHTSDRPKARKLQPTPRAYWKGLGADSEEKHEPASGVDTELVDSLKALDPERPIREADITNA